MVTRNSCLMSGNRKLLSRPFFLWFGMKILYALPFLDPVAMITTSKDSLVVESVYKIEGSAEPPSASGNDAFEWLSPFFGTAAERDGGMDGDAIDIELSGCWNTTEDGREVEVECRCVGGAVIDIPDNFTKDVSRISVVRAGLVTLRKGALQTYASTLKDLILMNVEQLEIIEDHAFELLKELRTIYIDHAPKLSNISDQVFAEHLPRLRILRIVHTGLHTIPNFSNLRVDSILHMIDLENNLIQHVSSNSIKVCSEQFLLNYNLIEDVEDLAFNEAEIARLSFKGNRRLCTIGEGGFVGLQSLRDLDLSETSITHIPTMGLQSLEILRLQGTESLKVIPSVYNFQLLSEAWLTYPYHCCAFKYPATHDPMEHAKYEDFVKRIQSEYCATEQRGASSELHGEWGMGGEPKDTPVLTIREDDADRDESEEEYGHMVFYPENKSHHVEPDWRVLTASHRPVFDVNNQFDPYHLDPHHSFGDEFVEGSTATQFTPHEGDEQIAWLRTLFLKGGGIFHQKTVPLPPGLLKAFCGNLSRPHRIVECHPKPDPFNPCEDIMGNWWLRISAWIMAILSIVGNIAVLLVLLSCQFRMSVSKFLMCNLAIADLSMGAYLTSILVMDARTIGVYFNYAIDWQRGPGCQIAGFLTVFASELSIFTLVMITSERWYAITYAMHLDKRLRVSTAVKVMVLGWTYAGIIAFLPIIGISGYSKTSICLPMDYRDLPGKIYVTLLLIINGLAFVLICACYGNIYYIIRKNSRERQNRQCASSEQHVAEASNPQRWSRANVGNSDATVAKRMALLVFTDFACKAPIAFFGLTAMGGIPLIDVTHAKILLVFFYPLNSCANPFLYALLTKQYRRDLFTLLSRHGLFAHKAARYKGAFPGTENDPAEDRAGLDERSTGCWRNRSRGEGSEGRIHLPRSFLGGRHAEVARYGTQPSSQHGSFLTQASTVDSLKTTTGAAQKNGRDLYGNVIEMSQMERDTPTDQSLEPENISTSRVRIHGCENNLMDSTEERKWSRRGSPHPIRNSTTRLSLDSNQEGALRGTLSRVSECSPGSTRSFIEVASNI